MLQDPGWLAGTPEQPPFVSGSHLSGGGTIIEISSGRKKTLFSTPATQRVQASRASEEYRLKAGGIYF
jgi:hypothetical protein